MGNPPDSERAEAVETELTVGPGRRLRKARETRELTREAVAAQLRIDLKIVDALERDDYAHLPNPVFVRGYLRAYARLVELPAEALIGSYERVAAQAPPSLVLPRTIGPEMEARSGAARWIVVVLVAVSLLAFYQWWRLQHGAPTPRPPPPARSEQPARSTSLPEQPAPPPAAGPPLETLYGTPPAEAPLSAAPAAPQPVPAPQPQVAAPAPQPVPTPPAAPVPPLLSAPLVLNFKDDCWVVVRDASGRPVLQGLMQSGSRHAVDGKAPFQLTLGNSPAVEIEYHGQRFDQSRYNGPDRVARFTLGE